MIGFEFDLIEGKNKNDFQTKMNEWKQEHWDKEIIDIKYHVVSLDDESMLYSGLISFKDMVYY